MPDKQQVPMKVPVKNSAYPIGMCLKEMPMVSVVIPTYNRKDKLARLIDSILQSSYPIDKFEIIVVDDASTDGTYEYIKNRYSGIKIIKNEKEILISGSRNRGMSEAKGELIFFIDDDNIINENCLKKLVEVIIKDEKAGMVGPVMYFAKDPDVIWWAGTRRNMTTSRTYFIGRDITIPDEEMWETNDFPNAWMLKRSIIEKHNIQFDEKNFPFHYEESDFAYRIGRLGYKFYVVKKAIVYHDIPLPDDIKSLDELFHIHTEIRAYYTARNRIIFHRNYSKLWQFLSFILFWNWLITAYYLRIILFNSNRSWNEKLINTRSYLKGVFDGIIDV